MSVIMVYVACETGEEAEHIARSLLERKLIACANIMAQHRAVYTWEGESRTGPETAMILKTREELFEDVRETVCALHSYECPCVVAMPVTAGHDPFLRWIEEQTGAA